MAVNTNKSDTEKLPKSVYLIVIVLMIDLLGFTVILPIMPSIFEFYGSNTEDELYRNLQSKVQSFRSIVGAPEVFNKVLFGGLLGSMYSLLQFLASPILGALSDVYGRKHVLLISLIGIALSHVIWAFSNLFYIFIIARVVGGIFRANVSLSTAIVTDLCSVKTRGRGMALIGVAFAIGFIIGPMIGAVFAAKSWDIGRPIYFMPAIFALVMTVLDIILVSLCFEESLPPKARAKSIGSGISNAFKFINPISLFSFEPVQNISKKDLKCLQDSGIIYFIYLFLYSGLEFTLGFLTHIRFAFSSMQQGKMYLFSGIIMLVIQGGMVRRIPAGKELIIALSGALVIVPSFIIVGLSKDLLSLYFGIALYAYASATVIPCLTTTVSKLGSVDQKGTVIGNFRSLGSLARGLGPFVSAVAFWSLGSTVTYCLGGLLLTIPTFLLYNLRSSVQYSIKPKVHAQSTKSVQTKMD